MKKITLFSIIIIIPLWVLFYVIADKGVEYDPDLEKALKDELETIDLSKKFTHSIESLDLSNENLTSIQGLEHFINLKELKLAGNILTDSTAISNLENLIELDISFNQFKEINLNSPHLEKLNLEGNRLSSIEFVDSLENLTKLNIRDNDVLDLTSLEGLQKLQSLNIRGNKVMSLDALTNKNSLINLNARNNQINSIEPLVNLPLEERLNINGNDIEDLHLLEDKIKSIGNVDFEIGIQKPRLSVESGVYDEKFLLEMEAEEGHDIYYTLDGSMPTASSNKYEGTIEISEEVMLSTPIISNHKTSPFRDGFSFDAEEVKKGVTITAISSSKGQYTESTTSTYILDSDLFTSESLPVISLTIDPKDLFDDDQGIYIPGDRFEEDVLSSGNYYQKGRDFEKNGTMELFHVDEALNFKQDIGLRINGSYTRRLPQKSLRIYSRSDYGQSRMYSNIFNSLPYNEFNLLVLRNSGNDNNSTLLRDGLMHELVKERSVDVQAYHPTVVLINGEYWGIHNIRERFNEDYIDIKYNVKEEDLAMMTVYPINDNIDYKMDVGSEQDKTHFTDLLTYMDRSDMNKKTTLNYIETVIDVENYLYYVAYQVYYANSDSFSNNMTLWRKKTDFVPKAPYGHDGRWRWMLFDLDWGMGYGLLSIEGNPLEYNMIKHVLSDQERMKLFNKLMDNEEVKDTFIKTMLELLNSNFEPSYVKEEIDELAANIRPEVPQSIARWENIESVEKWEENLRVLYEFAEKRPEIVKDHLMEEFELTEDDIKQIEEEIIMN